MSLDNFLSFSVLFSCFLSAFFSILKFEYILDILTSFVFLSFCLITIMQLGISMIIKYTHNVKMTHFNDTFSSELEDLRKTLDRLEERSDHSIKGVHKLEISKLLKIVRRSQNT